MRPALEVLLGTLAALNNLQYLGTQSCACDPAAAAGGGVIWRMPYPLKVREAAVAISDVHGRKRNVEAQPGRRLARAFPEDTLSLCPGIALPAGVLWH